MKISKKLKAIIGLFVMTGSAMGNGISSGATLKGFQASEMEINPGINGLGSGRIGILKDMNSNSFRVLNRDDLEQLNDLGQLEVLLSGERVSFKNFSLSGGN